jgi:hypothetical protein
MTANGPQTTASAASPGQPAAPGRRRRWVIGLVVVCIAGAAAVTAALWSRDDMLPEADRQHLWDVEHRVTLLSHEGFAQLKTAFIEGDADALSALLAGDFTGRIPDSQNTVARDTSHLQAERWQDGGRSRSRRVAAAEFIRFLMDQRAHFAEPPGLSISPMNFSPVDRASIAGAWEGQIRFIASSAEGSLRPCQVKMFIRLGLQEPTLPSLAGGGWLQRCEVIEQVVTRADAPLMHDVTSEWGIDTEQLHDNWTAGPKYFMPTPGGAYVFDYNRDALLDVLITDLRHPHGVVVYAGLAEGGFADVTEQVGLPADKGRCAVIADLDNDGWEDLLFGSGRICRNVEGQRFEDVTMDSNFHVLAQPGSQQFSGAAVCDYDRDGLVDLYLFRSSNRPHQGSWLEGSIADAHGNQLLRNTGGLQFEDVTAAAGVDGGRRSTFTSLWLDADNDGWHDLYVINEFGNGVLLINQQGKTFEPHSIVDEPADFGSMGATVGDFNNDGRADIYVASMYSKSGSRVIANLPDDAYSPAIMHRFRRMVAGSQLYENTGELTFQRRGEEYRVADVGWAYGPALVDLDNDGWEDLFATTGFISRTHSKPDG